MNSAGDAVASSAMLAVDLTVSSFTPAYAQEADNFKPRLYAFRTFLYLLITSKGPRAARSKS